MIESAIHYILDNRNLNEHRELPRLGGRIYTGEVQNPDETMPYASVNLESNPKGYYSNSSKSNEAKVRFKIWHSDHPAGAKIRNDLIELFDNKSFPTPDLLVQSARKENDFAVQEPDGVWQFVIDFKIKHQKA